MCILFFSLGFFMMLVLSAGTTHATPLDHQHAEYTEILSAYVVKGRVNYAALKENREALDAYLLNTSRVSIQEFQGWTQSQQLAFLINVYNAETLQLIIDHYPVDSIKDIGGFFTKPWDLKEAHLFEKSVTLNNIEHDMIRKNYKEPRIHMALVCAAKGCPHLRDTAYTDQELDAQLNEQTHIFLSDSTKNYFKSTNNTLYVSSIFKWYREDFQREGNTLIQFVRAHAGAPLQQQLNSPTIRINFTAYDWSLNDKR